VNFESESIGRQALPPSDLRDLYPFGTTPSEISGQGAQVIVKEVSYHEAGRVSVAHD
jgi:hypothetical protein